VRAPSTAWLAGTPADAPLARMSMTERETLERLAEATRFLERTVANLSEAVLVVGHAGDPRIVREANRAAERIFGWTRDELIGSRTERLHVSSEFYERFGAESRAVLERGEVYRSEHPMRRKDGSVFEAHQTVALLDPAAGLAGGAVSVVRDVSEQVRAERALRESEERFREIAEHVQDVFWVTSADGRTIEYVSPTYARIWGRDPEEFKRNPDAWRESIHPDDAERVIAAADRQTTGGYAEEYRIVTPDGSVRWIWDRAFPVRNEDGTLRRVIGVAGDVTERRLLEERLRQVLRMEAIGRLAGGVAHDFNNLLTVIVAQSDLILLDADEGSELADDVRLIRGAAERGADLTRQLLAFSREQVMEAREVDVGEVVANLHRLLERLVGEQVELEVVLGSDVPSACVDPTQLEQVVVNLVVNAREAMSYGGTISVKLHEEWVDRSTAGRVPNLEPGRYVTLSVSDNGEGMDEATMARVFEPFFTTRRDSGGTGLGLATSYGIVRQSGGAIHVESSPGLGSTFVVRLPVAERPADIG
jgi:two-component system, cell cycle sensor histidine kinase and response regulator CckA